jgi:protein-tyrosine phosphatase
MADRGIDISGFRSRQVTAAMALAADLILVMDEEQKKWCGALAPSSRGRIYLLGGWLPPDRREISDPFGRGPEAFLLAMNLIQQSVATWQRHLQET